jgi:hypothetical protein
VIALIKKIIEIACVLISNPGTGEKEKEKVKELIKEIQEELEKEV